MEQVTAAAATAVPSWITPTRLDRGEQGVVVLLWALLAYRVYGSTNPFAILALIAESSVLIFTLVRRPPQIISLRLGDWLLAGAATYAPFLIQPSDTPDSFGKLIPLALVLVGTGTMVQLAAKLSLRRSFGIAPANRGIKTSGVYRYVRHPMYAGYLFAHIGILILMPSVINFTIYATGWAFQIKRLLAEERLLGRDPVYRAFAEKTRWRLVPGLF
jgi:protein-S-isoprenylcysteine O-methyltransferase Ste14